MGRGAERPSRSLYFRRTSACRARLETGIEVRLLLDTNIFLEVILDQTRSKEARRLLTQVVDHDFFISDYSLHSIGLLLTRRRKHEVFRKFIKDMISGAGVTVLSIPVEDLEAVTRSARKFNLDFDDAYQFTLATLHQLTLVSFDGDFDRTSLRRKTPAECFK